MQCRTMNAHPHSGFFPYRCECTCDAGGNLIASGTLLYKNSDGVGVQLPRLTTESIKCETQQGSLSQIFSTGSIPPPQTCGTTITTYSASIRAPDGADSGDITVRCFVLGFIRNYVTSPPANWYLYGNVTEQRSVAFNAGASLDVVVRSHGHAYARGCAMQFTLKELATPALVATLALLFRYRG